MYSGYLFAVKKLLKNSVATMKVASDLISIMDTLLGLDDDNILPYTHCIEYATELWLATPMCEYNLETYIDLINKKPNSFSLNLRNTVKQVRIVTLSVPNYCFWFENVFFFLQLLILL